MEWCYMGIRKYLSTTTALRTIATVINRGLNQYKTGEGQLALLLPNSLIHIWTPSVWNNLSWSDNSGIENVICLWLTFLACDVCERLNDYLADIISLF